jgi:3-dehydroquinate dehydratase-2
VNNLSGIRPGGLAEVARFSFQKGSNMRALIIHGPNLNLLGEREPEVYGSQTLADVNEVASEVGKALEIEVTCVQHNGEGDIIDALQGAPREYEVVIINPGAYAHYSHAIADTIRAIDIPVIEVHMSNTAAREEFRTRSVIAPACAGSVAGFGANSYVVALHAAAKIRMK